MDHRLPQCVLVYVLMDLIQITDNVLQHQAMFVQREKQQQHPIHVIVQVVGHLALLILLGHVPVLMVKLIQYQLVVLQVVHVHLQHQ